MCSLASLDITASSYIYYPISHPAPASTDHANCWHPVHENTAGKATALSWSVLSSGASPSWGQPCITSVVILTGTYFLIAVFPVSLNTLTTACHKAPAMLNHSLAQEVTSPGSLGKGTEPSDKCFWNDPPKSRDAGHFAPNSSLSKNHKKMPLDKALRPLICPMSPAGSSAHHCQSLCSKRKTTHRWQPIATTVKSQAQNVFCDCCLKVFSFHCSLILRHLWSPRLTSRCKI